MKTAGVSERPPLSSFRGVPLVKYFAEVMGEVEGFQAHPDDLLIATYPKSGTTWISEIIDLIRKEGDVEQCRQNPIYMRVPFLEFAAPEVPSGIELLSKALPPRLIKTHLPVPLVPKSFWEKKCKIIYVARNLKDNAVSRFHFHRMNKMNQYPGPWDQFLEEFIAGKIGYGSWFDHVCGWWEAKDRHPILYLFYEDMKEDPAQEIQKVAQFLGLVLPEPVLCRIVQHTEFESMKVNPMTNYSTMPSCLLDQATSPFMRKGTVGDWKEHFTVAQNDRLDGIYAQEMGDRINRMAPCPQRAHNLNKDT